MEKCWIRKIKMVNTKCKKKKKTADKIEQSRIQRGHMKKETESFSNQVNSEMILSCRPMHKPEIFFVDRET